MKLLLFLIGVYISYSASAYETDLTTEEFQIIKGTLFIVVEDHKIGSKRLLKINKSDLNKMRKKYSRQQVNPFDKSFEEKKKEDSEHSFQD